VQPVTVTQRFQIETFEGEGEGVLSIDPELATSVVVGLQEDVAPISHSLNNIAVVSWDASQGETGALAWDFLDGVGFSPLHVSVRVGNLFDGFDMDCASVASEGPLSFDVALESVGGGRVKIRVPTVIVQDHDETSVANICAQHQVMRTFRIPLSCFTADGPGVFDVEEITRTELRVGEDAAHPSGALMVDSIELTRTSVESMPDCSIFEP
jgi:hypothetical protein